MINWNEWLSTRPLASKLWYAIKAGVEDAAIPTAIHHQENDGFQFAWDKDEHHLDIDILSNESVEWFYRNRETNKIDGTEDGEEIDFRMVLIPIFELEKFYEYLKLMM